MAINVGTAIAYLTLDKSPFNNGLKSAGAELKNFIRGTGEAGGRIKSLGGALTSVGGTLTKTVTLPIVGIGTACTKMASDFETSMAKIDTIAGASKKELADMRKEILKASSEYGMAAKDFAQATYDSISSGIDKADAVAFTKDSAKLAKAGFTDVATATDTLTSVINAYGKSSKDATDISNQMIIAQKLGKVTVDEMGASLGNVIPIASALGVKTEELFSSIAVATAQGIKPAQSITGLKAAMSNIVKPSKEAKKAAKTLGLQFDANAVKTKGWMGFLQDVKSKLEESAPTYAKKLDEVNKLKKAIESSGGSSKKYKEEIEKEREKIKVLREEKKNLTSKDKDRKKAIDNEIKSMQEHIKTMQKQSKAEKDGASNVKEMKKALKEKEKELKILEGTSKDTLSAFSTMFGSVEGLNTVMSMTSNSGVKLYDKSMKEMKEDTNATQEAFDKMMDTPEEKFKKAREQLHNLGITIGGYLLPHVSRFLDAFSKLLELIDKLPEPVKHSIVSFAGMAALSGPLMMLGGNVIKMGGNIVKGVSKIKDVPKIITGVAGGVKRGVGGIVKAFKLIPKAAGVFKTLPALITPHTFIIAGAILAIGFIVYEVIKHWDKLVAAGKKMGGILEKIFKGIGDTIKWVIGGWKLLIGHFINWGKEKLKNIKDGFINGINKVKGLFKGKGKELGKGVKEGFESELEIHSPSRVFVGYGGYIGEGLVEGIDKQEGSINTKFKGLANKIKDLGNVRPEFDGLNNLALSGAGSGYSNIGNSKQLNFNPTINMNVTVADTGGKGTEQLTQEVNSMGQVALKNGLVDLFMKDAVRN
ncbi:phage tail tape measure protein [Clostridium tetani]|uniref:phage tail tape measure protein n=1 Tax=Clostridium tetani TaxID=1513 RepID=UPI0024A93D43|nr:phage tail tape measure protein [Clostridium tetani]